MEDEGTSEPTPTYRLSLKGAGVSIERDISERAALAIIATVMGGEIPRAFAPRPHGLASAGPGVGVSSGTPSQSVAEYLTDVGAKRNPDKILAFGSYLMTAMGRETFTRDDVRGMFQRAGEGIPGNFHRDFALAVSNRWLSADPGNAAAFYVTKTGRTALETNFADSAKGLSRPAPRRRRKKGGNDVNGGSDDKL